MKKTGGIHPELRHQRSLCWHGDMILIADGNYPLVSASGGAGKVYLGLCAGVPTVTQVLHVLLQEVDPLWSWKVFLCVRSMTFLLQNTLGSLRTMIRGEKKH